MLYEKNKISFYSNSKDKVPNDTRNHAIYKIKLLGCNGCHIGKTERCLITRITEHDTKETGHLFKCLSECEMNLENVVDCVLFRHNSVKVNVLSQFVINVTFCNN